MSVREYIGARYVPLFADPIDWDSTKTYEPLTVVYNQGNSYTSRQYVPAGIDISNDVYWAKTGNYNAQIEQYRYEVATIDDRITTNETHLRDIMPFDETPTEGSAKGVTSDGIKKAIDAAEQTNADAIAIEVTRAKEAEQTNADAITRLTNTFVPATNPIYYGADPTGKTDSSAAINRCIASNKTTVFSPGTYLINSPIETDYLSKNRKSIDFNGATIECDFADFALKIGSLNFTDKLAASSGSSVDSLSYFKNGTIMCKNASGCGIKVKTHYMNAVIDNMNVYANKYGIYCGDTGVSHPTDVLISNCFIAAKYRTNTLENSVGINITDTDETISNTRIYFYDTCIHDKAGGKLNNIHILGAYSINLTDGIGIFVDTSGTLYENIYIDTYKTGIKAGENAGHISLSNYYDYAWSNISGHISFDFSDTKNFNYTIENVNVDVSNQPQLKLLVPSRTINWPLRGFSSSLTNVSFSGDFDSGKYPDLEYLYVDNNTISDIVSNTYITSILTKDYGSVTIEFTDYKGNVGFLTVYTVKKNDPINVHFDPIKAKANESFKFVYEYNWSGNTCLIKLKMGSNGPSLSNIRINRRNSLVTRPFSIGYALNNVPQPTINETGIVTCQFTV